MARARRAARGHRGRRQDARAAPHRLPRVRARRRDAGSHPDVRFAGAGARPTPRASAATTPWAPGGDVAAADRCVPARRRRGCPRAGGPGRRGARRRARRRGGRRRRDRHAARRPRARGRARSPRSPTSCAATIVGDVVTFVRNRNINYTNVCTFKCRFCAFSKGPLSLNLRGDPVPARPRRDRSAAWSRRSSAAPPRCACRAASTPTSTATTTSTSPRAVKEVAPEIHVHGFTALEVTEGARRLGMPLARLPAPR